MNKTLKVLLAFSVLLAYLAGLWLVLIHKVAGENGRAEPGFVLHWLRDSTLALPLVLLAVWLGLRLAGRLLERRGVGLTRGLRGAVTAAAVGLAAAAAMAVGVPIREGLLGTHEAAGLPLPLLTLRDALLALFVTVPVSAAVVALAGGWRSRRTPEESANARRTSRATFLKAGAGGLVTVAGGAAALRAVSSSSATAATATVKVPLLINEGYVKMTDGSPAFMRGFGLDGTTGAPMVPGPALGPPAASVPIGEVSFVLEGQPVEVTIKNTLKDAHSFLIEGVVGPVAIPAGATVTFTFNTPTAPVAAGTYIYRDADQIQRLLGLHGVLVVMPADGSRTPYRPRPDLIVPPTFAQQFVWVLHDVDPVWGEQARTGTPIVFETFLPRFFTINGVSGQQSAESRRNLAARVVVPDGVQGQGTLIRIANTGGAVHSPHFHGNHVYVLTDNGQSPDVGGLPAVDAGGRPIVAEKDVVRLAQLNRKDVLLPFHKPFDQWPPYDPANSPNYRYPMHCHAEMSQTAGGGQYPSGMYTEWELSGPLGAPKPIGG
jgi:hypothetical protein